MSATVIVKFQARPDKVQALLDFLSSLQPVVIEEGCKSISLLQDEDDPTLIFEVEKWSSADEHKKFIKKAAEAGGFKPLEDLLQGAFTINYLNTAKHTEA